MAKPLNTRQLAFVDEFLIDLNASAAARRAGYAEKYAGSNADKLLKNTEIARRIVIAIQDRSKRTQIDAAFVLQQLSDLVTADLAQIFQSDGVTLKSIHDWPIAFRHLLTSIETTSKGEATVVRVKFSDRVRHLGLLGRHVDVSAFQDKAVVDAGDNLVAYMEAAAKRVRERERLPAADD